MIDISDTAQAAPPARALLVARPRSARLLARAALRHRRAGTSVSTD
jgi:hypothetical protein